MRKPIIVGNWKMNHGIAETKEFVAAVDGKVTDKADWGIATPFLDLATAKEGAKNLIVAAENCHFKDSGAYTGEVSAEMVASMNKDAILFAMANPVPEIMPDLALRAGARVVGTGRSDFPNQINNVLAFPGIFRGALACRASCINNEMKVAATRALADLIPAEELCEECIIPPALDKRVAKNIAAAVIEAARRTGVARI